MAITISQTKTAVDQDVQGPAVLLQSLDDAPFDSSTPFSITKKKGKTLSKGVVFAHEPFKVSKGGMSHRKDGVRLTRFSSNGKGGFHRSIESSFAPIDFEARPTQAAELRSSGG